jgi:23S rRNA pseudouridine1911/1915/1917 synthase
MDTPKIIFEDANFAVINKSAGMVVNRADTTREINTLQDWVEENINLDKKEDDRERYIVNGYDKYEEFINRSGVVHRLDKETSGIILVAKNAETFSKLQKQFKSAEVKKKYMALVHGKIDKEEEISGNIGRLPWNRTRFGILPGGKEAKTGYKIISYKKLSNKKNEDFFTLLEVFPKTGRTHQIRVHMKHIGHPIFADELYAGRKTSRDDRKILKTHFLHASEISFINPTTMQSVTFSSELPEDLDKFLNTLESV